MSGRERFLGQIVFNHGLKKQYYDVAYLPREARLFVDAPSPYHHVDDVHSVVGFGISDKPILVGGIRNCCSVVLLGSQFAAATHHNLDTGTPEEYLPQAIQEMRNHGEQ